MGFAATHLRATIGVLAGTMCERRLGSSQGAMATAIVGKLDYALSLLPQTRTRLAARRWRCDTGAKDAIAGAVVVTSLGSRGLTLPDDIAGEVIRFHPALKFDGMLVGGMVALFRDLRTNAPCGIQRTFLDDGGAKLGRKMLGRARGAAIKLDADENVTLGLHIGEGFETCLAAWLAGFRAVWAVGSAGAIGAPSLSWQKSVRCPREVGDRDANLRAAQACAARCVNAEQDAFIVVPRVGGDLNDVWREVAR